MEHLTLIGILALAATIISVLRWIVTSDEKRLHAERLNRKVPRGM